MDVGTPMADTKKKNPPPEAQAPRLGEHRPARSNAAPIQPAEDGAAEQTGKHDCDGRPPNTDPGPRPVRRGADREGKKKERRAQVHCRERGD